MTDPNCHICHGDPTLNPICSRCPPDLPEARLRALADAATQGEWEAYSAICCPDMGGVSTGASRVCEVLSSKLGRYGHPCTMTDAALIAYAASPDRVRAIADVVEAARLAAEAEASFRAASKNALRSIGVDMRGIALRKHDIARKARVASMDTLTAALVRLDAMEGE